MFSQVMLLSLPRVGYRMILHVCNFQNIVFDKLSLKCSVPIP